MQASMPWFLIIPAMVLCGLLIVATVVGSVLFLSGRPRSGVWRVGGSLALVCGGILTVIALSAGILVPVVQQSRENHRRDLLQRDLRKVGEQLHNQQHNPDAGLKRLPDDVPADAVARLTGHDDRTVATSTAGQRPDWLNASLKQQGDVVHLVVSGQQFATIEEARHDVASEARKQLLADFEKTYGASARSLADLSNDDLRLLAVRKEFVETVERDFGNFFAPMHRVWWQVELSPQVRSELYPLWRGGEQQTRRRFVIFGFATATIGLALVSWLTRRKPVVQPPPQPAATNPVILGVGAATLLAQRCRRWWK